MSSLLWLGKQVEARLKHSPAIYCGKSPTLVIKRRHKHGGGVAEVSRVLVIQYQTVSCWGKLFPISVVPSTHTQHCHAFKERCQEMTWEWCQWWAQTSRGQWCARMKVCWISGEIHLVSDCLCRLDRFTVQCRSTHLQKTSRDHQSIHPLVFLSDSKVNVSLMLDGFTFKLSLR